MFYWNGSSVSCDLAVLSRSLIMSYAIYSSTNLYNNIIFIIFCILILIPCICEMVVFYRLSQLDIIRNAMQELVNKKQAVSL